MQRRLAFVPLVVLLMGSSALAAPNAAQILAANKAASGGTAWDGKAALKLTYDFAGMGMKGPTTMLSDLSGAGYVDSFDFGAIKGVQGYDGHATWEQDPSGTVTVQEGGDGVLIAVNEAYRRSNLWWRADRAGAAISASEKDDGGAHYDVLTVTPKGGKPFDAWFDAKTHLLMRTTEMQGAQKFTTTVSGYKAYDGAQFPQILTINQGGDAKYNQVLTLTNAQFLPKQDTGTFTAPKVKTADFEIVGGKAQTTLPFQLINNHIYAEAKVNGKGPYTFIFDTGGVNVVTPTTAKALGVEAKGNFEARGAGEGSMEAGFTNIDELRVGDAVLKKQVFVVFPLDAMANVEGIDMPGMVGFETFRRFVTRIDYGAKTLTLIDPKAFDPKDAGTPVPFKFNEHIPEVQGTFEGIPATFDIDTGSRAELTITKPFAEKNDLRARHPKGIDGVEGWGVGGPSRGYITRGASLKLGSVEVKDFVASMITQDKGAFAGDDYSGNIGSGILKRFVVTFDYDNKVMYLKPIKGTVSDVGTFDRSGMWINASNTGFHVVDVTKGGPAAAAGLLNDDVITAVDGKPATGIKLYDLRRKLRNDAPGTKVAFTVLRNKQTQTVTVTLKDQF